MPSIRQTSFAAGELDPRLWGRTDLPVYGKGARRMRGFVPLKSGPAMSRPGTTFVVGSKFVDSPSLGDRDAGQCRLLRFDAGDAEHQSYALELGNGYIRFVTDNAQVLDGGGAAYEIASPYTNAEIFEVQAAQLGDVIILAHANHPPQQLRRNGHSDWTLAELKFKPYAAYATDVDAPGVATSAFAVVSPSAWKANTNYVPGNLVTNSDGVFECITAGKSAGAGGPTGGGRDIVDGTAHWKFVSVENLPDPTHIEREWQWLWTTVVKDNETGLEYETLGQQVDTTFDGFTFDGGGGTEQAITVDKWAVYSDMPVILRRAELHGLISPIAGSDTYVVKEYRIYRGRGGLFGFVGSTKSREFVDVGDAPNYAEQPPFGTEPFNATTGYPRAVTFFQGRLVFAAPSNAGGDFYTSWVNNFINWDLRDSNHVESEAIYFRLASRRREDVRTLGVLDKLMLLSDASVWSACGGQGQPLQSDHVENRVEEEIGSTHLPPLIVDGALLYARAKGRGVRALVPQGAEAPFAGVDVSELAIHFFTGQDTELVDWCYQEDPHGIVWAVRADGALLSLTFAKDRWGWALHETDGKVESVCSVPEGTEDAVYIVVVRMQGDGSTHRYIERMTSRVQYGGPTVEGGHELALPADFICLDSALEYFGDPVQVIAGLDHLEGKEVWVIGPERDPIGTFTVTGGEIDLEDVPEANLATDLGGKLLVYLGLLYEPELESLDVASGESRLKKKIVERIGFEADQSIGLQVGQDFDNLEEWVQREDEDGFNAVSAATVLVDMPVDGTWDQSARAALRQSMPLPITIVGLTRELAFEQQG